MKKVLYIMALALACALCPGQTASARSIRTAIIAGQDGSHWWVGASDAMKRILENSGLFSVEVLITPSWGEDISTFQPDFSRYDLVILDYGGVEWAEPVKAAFERYVSSGGGVVVLHSAIIPMEHWQAYNEICGLGAWNRRDEQWGPYLYMQDGRYVYDYTPGWAGYHGLQHHIVVDHQAPGHPILKGLPEHWHHFKDEVYTHLRGPARNLEILATTRDAGRDEPMMWTVRYGKGRVFVDVMGHCGNDPDMVYSMTCTGFQVTFLRGCEWAATGVVTQEVPLDFPTAETYTLRPDFRAPFNAYPAK